MISDDKARAEIKRKGLYHAVHDMLDYADGSLASIFYSEEISRSTERRIEDVRARMEDAERIITIYAVDVAEDMVEFEKAFNIMLECILSKEQKDIPPFVWKATADAYQMLGQMTKERERDAGDD